MNALHIAARAGSVERTVALISRGAVDIDQGDPKGMTPLMVAACFGHPRVVRVLLSKGASASLVGDEGVTALHFSAEGGHLAATKLLAKAGADLEAKTSRKGGTPLHKAAAEGHSEVMRVLIEAGANPNSRRWNGSTPLQMAAYTGNVASIKVLLRAKANPLLTCPGPTGHPHVPLDVAASQGHSGVAHELIREYGVEGCGGSSGGVDALQAAAENDHVEMMSILTCAGVVDTGSALIGAVSNGRESSAKYLLQQRERKASGQRAGYLDVLTLLTYFDAKL